MENLTIMVQYFWLIKATCVLILAYAVGKAVVIHKLKSGMWNVIAAIFVVLAIVVPVKLSVNTGEMYKRQDVSISSTKVLVDKIEDKSFENTFKELKGIQKTDIEQNK